MDIINKILFNFIEKGHTDRQTDMCQNIDVNESLVKSLKHFS